MMKMGVGRKRTGAVGILKGVVGPRVSQKPPLNVDPNEYERLIERERRTRAAGREAAVVR
jgi:hypothetical protein